MHPPPLPARANFTLITERTPESSGCNSVYSVVHTVKSAPGAGRTSDLYESADGVMDKMGAPSYYFYIRLLRLIGT